MRNFILTISITALILAACVSISKVEPVDVTPPFVTSTLPPTNTPFAGLTTSTPTLAPITPVVSADCKDHAILVQDVTIPDGTNVRRGEKFTKTWQFQDTGSCTWTGYTIAFILGDRMSSPDSAPVPQTSPKSSVNVSVDLAAPAVDGSYTGYFELRNASGSALSIGGEKTFWVKITVGAVIPPTVSVGTPVSGGTLAVAPTGPLSCKDVGSPSYLSEIANLINSARAKAGLSTLAINSQLAAAAQGHSTDMACHGLLSHTGSDASTPYQRVLATGYSGSFTTEIIYAGGYPQDALDWWMNDKVHYDAIMDSGITEMGVGYSYVADSSYGSYITVDFGR